MSSDTLHDPLLGVTPVRRRASHAAAGGGGGQRALGSSMRRAYRKIRKASARSTFNRLKLFRLRTSVKLRVVDMSELGLWWALGWRSALREVSELLPWIVTLSVVGRLKSGEPTEDGKHSEPAELAAMALTEIWGYFFMDVSWEASSSTQAVLVSQAHGAKNVVAMRGWLCLTAAGFGLVTFIVSVLFWCTPYVLKLVVDPSRHHLVEMGTIYARWAIPALWLNAFSITVSVQMAAAQMPTLPMAIAMVGCCVDIVLAFVMVLGVGRWHGLKLKGAALAWVIGSSLGACAYVLALRWMCRGGREIAFREFEDEEEEEEAREALVPADLTHLLSPAGPGEGGWRGPALGAVDEVGSSDSDSDSDSLGGAEEEAEAEAAEAEALLADPVNHRVGWRRSLHYLASRRRWRAYLRQFLPSILSAMLNGWQYQVISFIAANRPEADIAAHNCALALFEISHALAVGLADSAAVRVGYHLGRGNAVAAKKAAIAAGCGTAGVAIAIAALGSLLRKYMGRMFSGDEQVVGIIESLADPFWLAFMCLCVGTVLLQVLAGQGRVRVQSGIYLISGYVVAVPGAFISYFVVNGGQGYGLLGLWYSLVAGNATLLALALFLVGRSDWPALAAFACAQQDRAEAAAAAVAAGAAPPETRQRPGVASKAATRREGVLAELDAEDEAANLEHLTRAREHAAPPTPLPLSSNSGRWNAA